MRRDDVLQFSLASISPLLVLTYHNAFPKSHPPPPQLTRTGDASPPTLTPVPHCRLAGFELGSSHLHRMHAFLCNALPHPEAISPRICSDTWLTVAEAALCSGFLPQTPRHTRLLQAQLISNKTDKPLTMPISVGGYITY
jgi:hypothetical protein